MGDTIKLKNLIMYFEAPCFRENTDDSRGMMQEGGSELFNREPNLDVPPQIEAADTTDEKIDQGSPQFFKNHVETIKPIDEILDERNLIEDEELTIKLWDEPCDRAPTFDVV